MKKIFIPALRSSLPAVLVFVLVNAAAEKLCLKITGISLEEIFVQRFQTNFDISFQIVNLLLFSGEIILVMVAYGFVRTVIASWHKAVFYTVSLFIIFTALFVGQLINLKIYPLSAAVVFIFSTAIAFPLSVCIGALLYEKCTSLNGRLSR